MSKKTLRAGIVGAGFISEYHLNAIQKQEFASTVGICDLNYQAAKKLAAGHKDIKVYTDLGEMLKTEQLDVVHVLTQPDSHAFLSKMIIEAGCHVILEKPVTTNSAEAEELEQLATAKGVRLAINHNFVFSRPFNRLKKLLDSGELGPLKSVRIVWKKPLPQMNFGPWDLWMLKQPGNILFETGSHSLSELLAITTAPESLKVEARLPKTLPSGSIFYRRWSISGKAGETQVQIDTAFDNGYDQHFVEVEGMFGVARADMENDVFTTDQPTGSAYDVERLKVNFGSGKSRMSQAVSTYGSFALSKFIKSALGNPYDASMSNGIANAYSEILGKAERKESSIAYAIDIAKAAEAIQAQLPEEKTSTNTVPALPKTVTSAEAEAKTLIIGASGFIGKKLLCTLQEKGESVRAIVRNRSSLTGVELNDSSEVMIGDYRNDEFIEKALEGIETVFHLAVAHGKSLDHYLRADSDPTIKFANLCQQKGIKRFIYTGTIDSLYLGPGAGRVKESDGVDKQIKRRNNYAHSKAITESRLMQMHKDEGFPLVIIRPAIVMGAGGPVNHVGVANWFGLGRCAYWGDGKNLIPLVLVEDIVNGLIAAIESPEAVGNIYNLSAEPCINAQQYVAEVEKVLGSKINAAPSAYFKLFAGDFFKWMIKVLARHPDKSRIPSIRDWRCREQHASFDTSKAEKDLNWKATNDRQTIIEKGIHEPARLFMEG